MRAGDHVRVLREGRWDHAIDCGDRTVIRLVRGATAPAIRRTAMAEFARDAGEVGVVPHRERVYPPREVVARAYSRMRDSSFVHMFADPEHFAVWCKSGLAPARRGATAPLPGTSSPAPRPSPARRAAHAKRTLRVKRPIRAKGATRSKRAARSRPPARAKRGKKRRR
jgi:hypothetical protein